MDIAEQQAGEITIVEVKGRIDSNTAKAFGERLTSLINTGRGRLVVDLKQIIYISSAGFRALLVAGRLADETKGTLALCGLSAELQRLFDLGAFTDLFTIYGSRDESIAKLTEAACSIVVDDRNGNAPVPVRPWHPSARGRRCGVA